MSYDIAAAALLEAVGPVAAYCQRTARPNRHADQLDHLIAAVADFGAAADAAVAAGHASARLAAVLSEIALRHTPPPLNPAPLVVRINRHLAYFDAHRARHVSPATQALALTITSHHLGIPASL